MGSTSLNARGVHRVAAATLVGMLLTAAVGCSPARPTVEGSVTLDGLPVDGGTIMLVPMAETDGTIVGGQITTGRYRLAGRSSPRVGRHRVEISCVQRSGTLVLNPANPAAGMVELCVDTIPARYNTESTLEVEVVHGKNTADFALDASSLIVPPGSACRTGRPMIVTAIP